MGNSIIHFSKKVFYFSACQAVLQPSSSLATSRYLFVSRKMFKFLPTLPPSGLLPSSPKHLSVPSSAEILSRHLFKNPQIISVLKQNLSEFFWSLVGFLIVGFFPAFNPNNSSEPIYGTAPLTVQSTQLRQQQTAMFKSK